MRKRRRGCGRNGRNGGGRGRGVGAGGHVDGKDPVEWGFWRGGGREER